MEDEHVVVADCAPRAGSVFCGVYDGHGGRLAVEFVQQQLHIHVEREVGAAAAGGTPPSQGAIHEALARAFLKVDRMLLQCGALHVGTTVAVCLAVPATASTPAAVHVANAGDSRVLLVSDGGAPAGAPAGASAGALRLSVDHVATDVHEMRRVHEAGGRVVNGRVGGSLAVTRALGDHALKGATGGVSAEPHCTTHAIGPLDHFVVLASDGVWDVLSDQDVRQLLLSHQTEPPAALAARVVQTAIAKGTRDNVSCLVLRLR